MWFLEVFAEIIDRFYFLGWTNIGARRDHKIITIIRQVFGLHKILFVYFLSRGDGSICLLLLFVFLVSAFSSEETDVFDVVEHPLVVEVLQLFVLAFLDCFLRTVLFFHFVKHQTYYLVLLFLQRLDFLLVSTCLHFWLIGRRRCFLLVRRHRLVLLF